VVLSSEIPAVPRLCLESGRAGLKPLLCSFKFGRQQIFQLVLWKTPKGMAKLRLAAAAKAAAEVNGHCSVDRPGTRIFMDSLFVEQLVGTGKNSSRQRNINNKGIQMSTLKPGKF